MKDLNRNKLIDKISHNYVDLKSIIPTDYSQTNKK